jgi:hypothetical protein
MIPVLYTVYLDSPKRCLLKVLLLSRTTKLSALFWTTHVEWFKGGRKDKEHLLNLPLEFSDYNLGTPLPIIDYLASRYKQLPGPYLTKLI